MVSEKTWVEESLKFPNGLGGRFWRGGGSDSEDGSMYNSARCSLSAMRFESALRLRWKTRPQFQETSRTGKDGCSFSCLAAGFYLDCDYDDFLG